MFELNIQDSTNQNSLEVIQYLISKGININYKTNRHKTLLHYACKNNSLEVIKYLISKGININAKTKRNETILHYACKNNSLEVIEYLISKGIDINAKTIWNETILHSYTKIHSNWPNLCSIFPKVWILISIAKCAKAMYIVCLKDSRTRCY
ncbi:cyclin-dependent kinase inhibitor 2c-related [Anaeramoeba ignava]|uniref:Cyclin-dependent kinase inhibitor 2c-related n=1 Tax=Anaeramoeba ignava TaxID=1746090 RepID=A0A9Q0RGH6_ANAIG|nr:cyclin-dependent kinase inhibitor 2c-related [Anaeramoeba ignava]